MGNPNDELYRAECECSFKVCGCCRRCKNCCDCHECGECDEDDNMYEHDSEDWCSECDRCKEHCCCDEEEEDEDSYYTTCIKCKQIVRTRNVCDGRHGNICESCAGCVGIPCGQCPLDELEKMRKTGSEVGVNVYYRAPSDEPPTKKEE